MRKKDYARLKGRWPNALKEYRAKKGLTMQQLSEQAGLHNGAYHEYETGRIQPGATTAICLARVLDCTVEDIWGGDEGPTFQAKILSKKTQNLGWTP